MSDDSGVSGTEGRGFRASTGTPKASEMREYIFFETRFDIWAWNDWGDSPKDRAISFNVMSFARAAALIGSICSLFFAIVTYIITAKIGNKPETCKIIDYITR